MMEMFSIRAWIFVFLIIFWLSLFMSVFLLFTPLRLPMVMYLLWMFLIDRNVCARGGRTIESVRDCFLWKHFASYFPVNSLLSSPITLDHKKNYIFAVYPHGVIGIAATVDFRSNHGNFKKYFPSHVAHSITLPFNFYLPFYREIILAIGSCSSSKESIEYLLSDPKGGHGVGIIPGGAAEAQYAEPGGIYKLVFKERKGFIKLALKHGTSIIPSFGFGEIDLFEKVNFAEGSTIDRLLRTLKWLTRIHFVIPRNIIPKRQKVTMICK